MTHPFTSEIP